jgi:DNA replication protein DnaC
VALERTRQSKRDNTATVIDAILDRIIHNAHRITLEGDSARKQKSTTPLTPVQNAEIIGK